MTVHTIVNMYYNCQLCTSTNDDKLQTEWTSTFVVKLYEKYILCLFLTNTILTFALINVSFFSVFLSYGM